VVVRVRFGPFVLDLDTRQLTRERVDVHLTPKALQLLTILVAERPKVVPKATLLERLWPKTFVAEANLSNLVAELREALGERRRKPLWIRTAHRFGYAFCGEAVTIASHVEPMLDRPTCWLEWGRHRFPLSIGEHVIGRDPDVDIRLDTSTVSRRHARVVVSIEGTWLEDCGSKNGTMRGASRITSRVPLCDGDVIHVGSLMLTFHVITPMASTDTLVSAAP
jgi:DNA-binding winged helix-turn-helix (wHTH) protein